MPAESRFHHSLDESLRDTLAPGALVIGGAYLLVGWMRWMTTEPGSDVYGPLQLATGVLMLSLGAYYRGRRFSLERARLLA